MSDLYQKMFALASDYSAYRISEEVLFDRIKSLFEDPNISRSSKNSAMQSLSDALLKHPPLYTPNEEDKTYGLDVNKRYNVSMGIEDGRILYSVQCPTGTAYLNYECSKIAYVRN